MEIWLILLIMGVCMLIIPFISYAAGRQLAHGFFDQFTKYIKHNKHQDEKTDNNHNKRS